MTLLLIALLAGCSYYDPMPGTIHLRTTLDGKPHSCMAQVWNADGKQIRNLGVNDTPVDIELPPGTYTLKFEGFDNAMYPAVVEVKLFSAGHVNLAVDLNQAPLKGTVVNGAPAPR
jgi:hypothetical protein